MSCRNASVSPFGEESVILLTEGQPLRGRPRLSNRRMGFPSRWKTPHNLPGCLDTIVIALRRFKGAAKFSRREIRPETPAGPPENDPSWRRKREDLLDTLAQVREGVKLRPDPSPSKLETR